MKQYYYLDGITQLGPFTLDELRTKSLTPDTSVWAAGMTGWLRAGDVPELSSLLGDGSAIPVVPLPVAPPVSTLSYQKTESNEPGKISAQPASGYFASTPKPRTWLVEAILVTIFCCLPFGIVGIVFAAKVDSAYTVGDFEGAQRASAEAGKWTKIGFFTAIGITVLYILLFGAGLLATMNTTNF